MVRPLAFVGFALLVPLAACGRSSLHDFAESRPAHGGGGFGGEGSGGATASSVDGVGGASSVVSTASGVGGASVSASSAESASSSVASSSSASTSSSVASSSASSSVASSSESSSVASTSVATSTSTSTASSSASSGAGGQGGAGGCSPVPEICNGADDDCDGVVDDGDPGGGDACMTGDPGACATGTTHCEGGMLVCVEPAPSPETCNGIDDDCNGVVDDGDACSCPSSTYGGHVYLFCQTPKTWKEALADCQAQGMHLLTINDAAEEAWVYAKADALSTEKYWMGLDDIAVEGMFVWEDGEPVTYVHWHPGEPNDSGGNEDCAQLNRFYPDQGWNDETCSNVLRYVCEQ